MLLAIEQTVQLIVIWDYNAYGDMLMQERHNSIANALELHLSCIKPSMLCYWYVSGGAIYNPHHSQSNEE